MLICPMCLAITFLAPPYLLSHTVFLGFFLSFGHSFAPLPNHLAFPAILLRVFFPIVCPYSRSYSFPASSSFPCVLLPSPLRYPTCDFCQSEARRRQPREIAGDLRTPHFPSRIAGAETEKEGKRKEKRTAKKEMKRKVKKRKEKKRKEKKREE